MTEERTIQLAQVPIGGMAGATWNRLHGEREDICELLLKRCEPASKELLQARLRTIDDELDRLMSGLNLNGIAVRKRRSVKLMTCLASDSTA